MAYKTVKPTEVKNQVSHLYLECQMSPFYGCEPRLVNRRYYEQATSIPEPVPEVF